MCIYNVTFIAALCVCIWLELKWMHRRHRVPFRYANICLACADIVRHIVMPAIIIILLSNVEHNWTYIRMTYSVRTQTQ